MMYPFLTLDDDTEIVHSEMKSDGTVKVYFEKPDEKDSVHNAYYILPERKWEEINGFSDDEIKRYTDIISSMANLIMQLSKEGGIDGAVY